MVETTRLLQLRSKINQKRPRFKRAESWRYKKFKLSWRRPKGVDNKIRKKKKGTPASPNVGYRSPIETRNLHPSGFEEIIVHNLAEMEKINPRKQVIKIAKSIGRRKRIILQDRADELDILILNRVRIMLPGEELLLQEGRGFEKETGPVEESETSEESKSSKQSE